MFMCEVAFSLSSYNNQSAYSAVVWVMNSQSEFARVMYEPRYESLIEHVNKIPTMQFFTGIFKNTQSELYMLSLTEWVCDFQNNVLWDTH